MTTEDGDFLDLDWVRASPERPHLLVLHGLEGSSASGYVRQTLHEARALGWGAVAMNFRSCSGEPNRVLRSYCSGETADPLFVARHISQRVHGPLLGMGFSLGGNALLKLLAETGEQAPFLAAAAVSAPFDLLACAQALDMPWGRCVVYRRHFLKSLKRKALAKLATHPGHGLDAERVRLARKLQDFDDAFTGPSNGYKGALDYYQRCSSGPRLGEVRRPTLLVNAEDDPMIPGSSLPEAEGQPTVTGFGKPASAGECQAQVFVRGLPPDQRRIFTHGQLHARSERLPFRMKQGGRFLDVIAYSKEC